MASLLLPLASATPVLAQNPGPALPRSTPEAQGVSSASLLALLDAIEASRTRPDSGVELHSLMVVRNGRVVAEGWWDPYKPDLRHQLFSLSKSFTSTAIGLAVAEGLFSLDDRVAAFFPDELPASVEANLAALRVRDLLSMSTGQVDIPHVLTLDGSWAQAFLAYPLTHAPGTHFYYNTMATFMLSAILQEVTGQTLTQYLTPRLFEPLGIRGAVWDQTPEGYDFGGAGLNARTEDVAKLAQLYLQGGLWNGRRILPEGWVEAATSKQIDTAPGASPEETAQNDWAQGYGYQFWRTTHGAYRGDGACGQFAVVLPEQNTVIAVTAGAADMQAVLNLFWQHLLPAIQDAPLPEDAAAQARLKERLASLSLLPIGGAATSPAAAGVSGTSYRLDANGFGAESISFDFEGDGCTMTVRLPSGERIIPCRIGGWAEGEHPSPFLTERLPLTLSNTPPRIAATGMWTAPDTFQMTMQLIEMPFRDRLIAHFEGDSLHLEFELGLGGRALEEDTRPDVRGRAAE